MATKKATPKKKAPEIDFEAVRTLGQEMNDIMFPEEPFDFESMADEEVLEQVKESAAEIQPTDEFSDESKATLATIGINIEWEEEAEEADETGSESSNLDDMDLDGLKAFAKEKGIRCPPPFLKDEDKLRGYITGKLTEAKGGTPAEKKKPAKKEKKGKGPSATGTVMEIVVDNPGFTIEQIEAALSKKGVSCSKSTISIQRAWTLKVINYINSKK